MLDGIGAAEWWADAVWPSAAVGPTDGAQSWHLGRRSAVASKAHSARSSGPHFDLILDKSWLALQFSVGILREFSHVAGSAC